jgi:hypothetical protein
MPVEPAGKMPALHAVHEMCAVLENKHLCYATKRLRGEIPRDLSPALGKGIIDNRRENRRWWASGAERDRQCVTGIWDSKKLKGNKP